MSNIPISHIVQINPRVIGAGSPQGSLDGLIVSQSPSVPPSSVITFYDANTVAEYFGPNSGEALAAAAYFPGIIGGGQQPQTLNFGRFAVSDAPAGVYGAPLAISLAQLQALGGTLNVTTSELFTSDLIDLAGATSFANAAALMTAGFDDPDFAITYDADRSAFVLLTTVAGEVATSTAITGTLANSVGLSAASGALLQAQGVDADTPATAMNRIRIQTGNWGFFTTAWQPTLADRLAFAAWTSGTASEFGYASWDSDAAALQPDNPASFGATVFSTPYQGVVPMFGGVDSAAGVLAWAASSNYLMIEGRNTLAFRQFTAGVSPTVTDLAAASALESNHYSYVGSFANAANDYSVVYAGECSGQFRWADTYLNQIWLRRTLQQALFETLLAYKSLPYNADGYNAVYQGAQDTVGQATRNGVIRAGVALSPSQRAQINAQAGFDIAGEVANRGWYLQVTDPLSVSVRAERGSPVVNFWYCDGGSIQKITVSSTAVL